MNIELEQYKSVWVRTGESVDKSMVKDCMKNYSHFNLDENSVVLDLGANIGAFGKMALSKNVKQYIVVEPDPENIFVLKRNIEGYDNTIVYEGAASVHSDDYLTFYQNKTKSSKCSGNIIPNGRNATLKDSISYNVKNYNIYELLEKHKPTHVKVDIEGAEIDWLIDCKGKFPKYIEQLSFEVHNKNNGLDIYSELFDTIEQDFRHINIQPNLGFPNSCPLKIYEKLGFEWAGKVWAIDIFLERNFND